MNRASHLNFFRTSATPQRVKDDLDLLPQTPPPFSETTINNSVFLPTPAPPPLTEADCTALLSGLVRGNREGEYTMFSVRFEGGKVDENSVPSSLRALFRKLRKSCTLDQDYLSALYQLLDAREVRLCQYSSAGRWENDSATGCTAVYSSSKTNNFYDSFDFAGRNQGFFSIAGKTPKFQEKMKFFCSARSKEAALRL